VWSRAIEASDRFHEKFEEYKKEMESLRNSKELNGRGK